MSTFILFYLAAALCTAIHVLSLAAASRLARSAVEEIELFSAPLIKGPVVKFRANGVQWRLGFFPISGYIKSDFVSMHPFKRSIVVSAGCAALIVFSILLIGPAACLESLANGFDQVLQFVMHPLAKGPGLLLQSWRFFADSGFIVCLGVMAAKVAAINLMPWPSLNGFEILCSLLECLVRIPIKAKAVIYTAGTLGSIIFLIELVIAAIGLFHQ